MSLEKIIDEFCSRCINEREHHENSKIAIDTACSRCSQCSQTNLHKFILECCQGFAVSAQKVSDDLLSEEDKQDIINGDITEECLRAHIKTWLEQGAPHYATKSSKNS